MLKLKGRESRGGGGREIRGLLLVWEGGVEGRKRLEEVRRGLCFNYCSGF